MAYRYDPDLEFLRDASNEDLDVLVNYLTKDKDGSIRFTEELTCSGVYKRFYPNHHVYWDLIAEELQCYGGNTLANIFRRGKGVLYAEILNDVCDNLKVSYDKMDDVYQKELNLLITILKNILDKMSLQQRSQVVEDLEIKVTSLTTQSIIDAIQAAIEQNKLVSYKLSLLMANAIAEAIQGKGINLAINAGLARVISVFFGPVVMGAWAAHDIAGPAYRVTIPSVVHIAFMRRKYLYNAEENNTETEEQKNVHDISESGINVLQFLKKNGSSTIVAIESALGIESTFRMEELVQSGYIIFSTQDMEYRITETGIAYLEEHKEVAPSVAEPSDSAQEEKKEETKSCPQCGKTLPQDANFCSECGYAFPKD